MPKKTKKEKIIAELRRKLETVKVTNVEEKMERQETTSAPATKYQLPTTNYSPVSTISFQNQSSSYILKDLRKTFILAGLAISFELVLYLVWR